MRFRKVCSFVRILGEIVQASWLAIPTVDVVVLRRVLAVVPDEQFPVAVDTPTVLQRVVGVNDGDVVNRGH